MNRWVIDCSMALSWCLPDETSAAADRFFSAQQDLSLLVPGLFWYETANALTMAVRRKRITVRQASQIAQLLRSLPLTTSPSSPQTLTRLLPLTATHNLSAYDAAYLDLAITQKAALATTDTQLQTAAQQATITIYQ